MLNKTHPAVRLADKAKYGFTKRGRLLLTWIQTLVATANHVLAYCPAAVLSATSTTAEEDGCISYACALCVHSAAQVVCVICFHLIQHC